MTTKLRYSNANISFLLVLLTSCFVALATFANPTIVDHSEQVQKVTAQASKPQISNEDLAKNTAGASLPRIPERFDERIVNQLIKDIEIGHNASILKVGYFMRRKTQTLPLQQGYALITAAVLNETPGTGRWICLQQIRAVAAFRVPGINSREGYAIYDSIFDFVIKSSIDRFDPSFQQAIDDYLFMIQGRFHDLGLQQDQRTIEGICKAWSAYVKLQMRGQWRGHEPMWKRAIIASASQAELLPLISDAARDPRLIKNYGVMRASATVLSELNPQKAIDLLYQIKPILPQSDPKEVVSFYDDLVSQLCRVGKENEAIIQQKDLVKRTDAGRARLVTLYLANHEAVELLAIISELSAFDAPEREIIATADALSQISISNLPENQEAASWSIDLLSSYLSKERTRKIEIEVRARHMLGLLFLRQNRLDEAMSALCVDTIRDRIKSPQALQQTRAIQQIIDRIQEKMKLIN